MISSKILYNPGTKVMSLKTICSKSESYTHIALKKSKIIVIWFFLFENSINS